MKENEGAPVIEEEDAVEDVTEEIADGAEESAEEIPAQMLVGGADEEGEIAASDIGTYGDLIVEELSVETNVRKVTRFTKVPEKVIQYIFAVLYLAVGALCIAMPHGIEYALPYIVGAGMAAYALVQFIFAIVQKEYRKSNSNRTASALIIAGLSVMIIIDHEWAHTFIPIVWGILGLCEGAHAFNLAISRISHGLRAEYYVIKGIIEVVVAFLLLYKPEEYGELHIIVFGVSLIIDGITIMPFVKKFLTRQ